MKRRKFVAIAGTGIIITGSAAYLLREECATGSASLSYQELVAETWRHSGTPGYQGQELMRELVRYATLAANSHNTQLWRFKIEPWRITILPDFTRRCPVVDPDDHHLFVSLGCATENLMVAAEAYGLRGNVSFENDAIQVDFEPVAASKTPLFQAIPKRQCTKSIYDTQQVPITDLASIEQAVQKPGTMTQVFTDKKEMGQILEYVVAGNTAQMEDPAFVKELRQWIRFSKSSATCHRDGLFSGSAGSPALPTRIGQRIFKYVFKTEVENDKYRDQIRSSSGIIAFSTEKNDKESWVNVGRSYQRFALQSTAIGYEACIYQSAC